MRVEQATAPCLVLLVAAGLAASPATQASAEDRSGRAERGKASFYAETFNGHRMADGRRYSPGSDAAASKSLPLGTTAKVTNLRTGKSATVQVEDRGPYARGRVMDVSPKVAHELDMKKTGVAPVEVKPIAIPEPDGKVKLGSGAAETPPGQVAEAVRVTKELSDRR
ncbi:MAG TPA: septal ring lytic transglycosylase RlpA family protein [Acetobacteraceae bacterium]|nr:septal ring lytic transglycosylase RlpA family protein [Acetobacteraceae bacterium]